MSKQDDVKVMLREAGILFAITLLSGLLLGFVYELTREPRRLQQERLERFLMQRQGTEACWGMLWNPPPQTDMAVTLYCMWESGWMER